MGIPFPDIDPYEVLGVDKDASPILIKKTYKRLCLKHHPDKIKQMKQNDRSGAASEEELFTKIQFSYSILSDPVRRNRFDTLGSLSELNDDYDDEGFDWKEYFQSMNERITVEMIEEDRVKYQKSKEEREDIVSSFIYYEGDFLKLFEVIPHLDFTESEEERVYKIIEQELPRLKVDKSVTKSWEKYTKSRKTKVKNMLKKLAKEAKEAEELQKQLKKKNETSQDLASLIKGRQNNRLDSLISNLEAKYGKKKGTKRSSKDIDDDEFERIQAQMFKKSK
ncbi:DnaJ domain family protein [Candida parapsilosis]|uniref:J domain-containing protein n=2 Tax=Candida parapsilosis TaxID=5480 RepID=G8BHF4_CANPC|nr:uncharacterized protein CPAR2_501040 [Candida parapsilosis]KAF6044487.1 DnaJ domain family protein [Candida parapsilosis]KAF6045128.1 DnaJ domain family protein [Candida parapsilosis]KAF6048727.1 DnaJ domain family protein [Candida parapsilosis]KAF6060728.1 DnaJ domain family protein [Candida parapsilosis]KAI5900996.1 putative J domain-containing protein [Candida parapsilosis]